MALGTCEIVERPLVRCELRQQGQHLVKVGAGIGIVPFVIEAYSHVCLEAWVQLVPGFELAEDVQRLMVFPALEILYGHAKLVAVLFLRPAWHDGSE